MTGRNDTQQLVSNIMHLNDCTTCHEVRTALSEISCALGFDSFLYSGRFYTGVTRYIEHNESNYAPSWREKYDKQHYADIDPTVSHSLKSLCPLVWDDGMYTTEPQRHFKEEARMHGLAEGITLPVHSRNGDVALLSLAVSRSGEEARHHVRATLVWGALLATATHESVRRIVKNQRMAPAPKLTRREIEVLQLVAGGKSTWEMSRLLSISEHGVSHHVRNVLLKFDVASRHQAVAKASAFGLL
jgi:LuxR family quorum-sensing transcriptional regulator LasR